MRKGGGVVSLLLFSLLSSLEFLNTPISIFLVVIFFLLTTKPYVVVYCYWDESPKRPKTPPKFPKMSTFELTARGGIAVPPSLQLSPIQSRLIVYGPLQMYI